MHSTFPSLLNKSLPPHSAIPQKTGVVRPGGLQGSLKWMAVAGIFSTVSLLSAADLYFIAHRGEYRALENGVGVVDAPEGTRPTYERVRDKKINAVKLDLHYTADKVVVISHDPNLKRTTGKDLPIVSTPYAALKDAPFLKVGAFEKERILTLEEALKILKDCPLYYVDFKYHTPEMMTAAFESFSANGIPHDRIILATFTQGALLDAKERYPDVKRVLHVQYREQKDGSLLLNGKTSCVDFKAVTKQLAEWKTQMGLYGYNLPTSSKFTTLDLIRQLKSEGCWLSLWYVHSTKVADDFRDSGVDAFVTGMPSALRTYLEK
jgi:glycerophosphoryl diester phosphodiesterase